MAKLTAMFDGSSYDPEIDYSHLSGQLDRVQSLMEDGSWRSLHAIADILGEQSVASVSARLRDLRKVRFGGREVQRRRVGKTHTFEYRLIPE
ncbi:MAG: hypothetical protein ACXABY_01590 [Candidatus Thorarchaeota archaeon]|jgi:hypothetical protein